MIRSLWWAAETGGDPPFGTAHLKVHYPAAAQGDRLTGTFPPEGGPYPVVLFLSGINVGQDAYRWLAIEIARAGFVCVTFDRVGELFGGQYGLTPGVDLEAASPAHYGTRPTCPAIGDVLASLARIDLLKGVLDLDRVAIGGHSAGGTVAMQSARFFPGVKAVFSYGAHTMVATMLGWPAGTVLPAQADCPVLLSVGTRDGVIQGSADRYGQDGRAPDPVTRTFEEALGDGEHLLAVFEGANHFLIADPVDPTAARAFLDLPATAEPRPELAGMITAFLRTHLCDDPEARTALADLPARRKHA
ncbi:dienelactone hydrolase family protein [Nonomuraea sp. MCN248]|uniref:Dienelactone hydrolase family protein n=1 Tax=Nonomuraea corallina TaxID=2989783 RepID=A0ABT4SNM8_9ACTN|nr:dienelactone hydrolase family protein [Nonomuraea corallina]MDA0638625.1 dienelactone hydrolase family protein [Nonomuraea corallina]